MEERQLADHEFDQWLSTSIINMLNLSLAQRASSARTTRESERGRRLQIAKESGLENRVLVAGDVTLFCVKVTVGQSGIANLSKIFNCLNFVFLEHFLLCLIL